MKKNAKIYKIGFLFFFLCAILILYYKIKELAVSYLKRYPYFSFFIVMLFFGVSEVIFTPFLSYLAEEGLAITVPLGYLAQALAVIAPFLMLGAAIRASEGGFSAALPFFFIYFGVRILMQFPLAIYEYSVSLSTPYLFVLFVYVLTAILNCLFFFFLLLLGFLLFKGNENKREPRFFGFGGKDTRILWLSTLAITTQKTVLFVISYIEHLKSKLWIFEGKDALDALISVIFIAFCTLLSFAVGRFAMRVFSTESNVQE